LDYDGRHKQTVWESLTEGPLKLSPNSAAALNFTTRK
jgi:hypothetical protein